MPRRDLRAPLFHSVVSCHVKPILLPGAAGWQTGLHWERKVGPWDSLRRQCLLCDLEGDASPTLPLTQTLRCEMLFIACARRLKLKRAFERMKVEFVNLRN
jgi:hypothetical protein